MGNGNRITAKMLDEIHAQLKSGVKRAVVASNFGLSPATIAKIDVIMKKEK